MKVSVKKDNQNLEVFFEGYIEYDAVNRYLDPLRNLLEQHPIHVIIFDFQKLNFVGSTGTIHFIKALSALNHYSNSPCYRNIVKEFKILFDGIKVSHSFKIIDVEENTNYPFSSFEVKK